MGGRRLVRSCWLHETYHLISRRILPADTRLWAALQQVSGGTWGGYVYDVDAIMAAMLRGNEESLPS
jgi:hypothetical protein